MKNRLVLISIPIILIILCCFGSVQQSISNIYGISIGDTLSSDFTISKVQDFPFSKAVYKWDNRLTVSLINNYISSLRINELTQEEHIIIQQQYSEILNKKPKYFKDTTPFNIYGVKGELFYWVDSLSGLEVYLSRNSNKSNFSYLSVHNSAITDSLINLYPPEDDSKELELIIFD